MTQLPALSRAERAVTVGRQRIAITCTAAMSVFVRACVRTHVHACVRDVFAIYNNTILPRLIMIRPNGTVYNAIFV